VGRVTTTERAAILARIIEIVAAANPDMLRHAYDDLADRKVRASRSSVAGSY
jgi:hypothetical protein